MCPKGVRTLRAAVLALAALALSASTCGGRAAELPSQGKKTTAKQGAAPARRCNIGGVTGVVAADGVCMRISGYVSTRFSAGQIK